MFPLKPQGALTRTAAAAKTKWISGGGQQSPGFFISTPQYQRQRATHNLIEDGRRKSESLDTSFCLTFPGGSSFTSGAALSSLDEDDKDVNTQAVNPKYQTSRKHSLAGTSPVREFSSMSLRESKPKDQQGAASGDHLSEKAINESQAGKTETAEQELASSETKAEPTENQTVVLTSEASAAALPEQLATSVVAESSAGPLDQMKQLNAHKDYTGAVVLFRKLESEGEDLSPEIYDELFVALGAAGVQSGDLTILLHTFEDALARGLLPTTRIYQVLLTSLVEVAKNANDRHMLPFEAVGGNGSDYAKLAIALFTGVVEGDISKLNRRCFRAIRSACNICDADLSGIHSYLTPEQSAFLEFRDCSTVEEIEQAFLRSSHNSDRNHAAYVHRLLRAEEQEKAISHLWRLEKEQYPDMSLPVLAAIRGFSEQGLDEAAYRWMANAFKSSVLKASHLAEAFLLVCQASSRFAPVLSPVFEAVHSYLVNADDISPELLTRVDCAFLNASLNLDNFGGVVLVAKSLNGQIPARDVTRVIKFMCARDAYQVGLKTLNEFCNQPKSDLCFESPEAKLKFYREALGMIQDASSLSSLEFCVDLFSLSWEKLPEELSGVCLSVLSEARVAESIDLAKLIEKRPHSLRLIALSYSRLISRASDEVLHLKAYSLILSDCIMNKVQFTEAESDLVTSALGELGLPTWIWSENCNIGSRRADDDFTSSTGSDVATFARNLEHPAPFSHFLDSQSLLLLRTDVEVAKETAKNLLSKGRYSDAFFLMQLSNDKSMLSLIDEHLAYIVHVNKSRDEALKYAEAVKSAKITPTDEFYLLLMEAWLLPEANLEEADKILLRMNQDGARLNGKHFGKLIWARGVLQRDLVAAQEFYRGLVKNSRFKPDESVFSALIDSYVVNGRVEGTKQVLYEMNRYRVPVSEALFQSLKKGWKTDEVVSSRIDEFVRKASPLSCSTV